MSCFLLPLCLHKAVSLPCLEGHFVTALWTAQAENLWDLKSYLPTLCNDVRFSWTLGLSLGALCGPPQWGSITQVWAAEASPKGWLRVGPVPSSNLELPGGCKVALTVSFAFRRVCLALQGSAPQRYLSSSVLDISGSYVPTQEVNTQHLLQIQACDFEPLVYHVLVMTGLKRDCRALL